MAIHILCPESTVFEEEPEILTVRRVYANDFLAENSTLSLVLRSKKDDIELHEGMTVAYWPFSKAIKVLEPQPIPRLDLYAEKDPETFRSKERGRLHYSDFGGYTDLVDRVAELFDVQFNKRNYLDQTGVKPLTGMLFVGEPGVGKTFLGQIIASEVGAAFYLINGPEIVTKWVGDSESILRKIFEDAERQTNGAIIFFDEIDSLAPSRQGNSNQHDTRLVGQLLSLMGGYNESSKVFVIASTNRASDLDPALKRSGRFDRFEVFGLPVVEDRVKILLTSGQKIKHTDVPIEDVAVKTEGYSSADLCEIWSEAGQYAASEERGIITAEDFMEGFRRVTIARSSKERFAQ